MALTFLPSIGPDMGHWLKAGNNVIDFGFVEGYRLNQQEHPPGLSIIMSAGIRLSLLLDILPAFGIKIILFCFFLISWSLIEKHNSSIVATLIVTMVLSLNALVLSYVDILLAPFLLLTFISLKNQQPARAAIFFTLASMIKFYPLIIAPFMLVYFLSLADYKVKKLLNISAWPIVLLAVTILVYQWSLLDALYTAFSHKTLSAQGLNVNWLIQGSIRTDNHPLFSGTPQNYEKTVFVNFTQTLLAFFYVSTLWLFLRSGKRLEDLLLFSIIAHLSYFVFAIGVHENHLYLSFVLSVALAMIKPSYTLLAINIALMNMMNYLFFYNLAGDGLRIWGQGMTSMCQYLSTHDGPIYPYCTMVLNNTEMDASRIIMSIINTLFFLGLWVTALKNREPASNNIPRRNPY
ncbi:MAG: hypothetical protein KDI30_11080 [Pseudomonadales bacterium]|nr:hypothetical protein [Pseudomonadales bacterium]